MKHTKEDYKEKVKSLCNDLLLAEYNERLLDSEYDSFKEADRYLEIVKHEVLHRMIDNF